MKYLLLIILAAFFYVAFHPQPKEVVTVKVVVQQGDVLQNIIWKLKEKYGDSRDWREICYYAGQKNALDQFIYPGQVLYIDVVKEK